MAPRDNWASATAGFSQLEREKFLHEHRNEEMLKKLNRVYEGDPGPEECRIVEGYKSKFHSASLLFAAAGRVLA